jgi:lipopolysaccharide heptosyltransferase II
MKILIVGPAWVGDMVIAHALVRTLVAQNPGCEVHVLAPVVTEPLARRMPGVAGSTPFRIAHGELAWRGRRELGREMARAAHDWAIVLPNTFKSALVPFFARIPRRTGWRGELRYGLLNDLRVLDAARYPRLIDRFVALASVAGAAPCAGGISDTALPQLTADRARASALLDDLHLDVAAPILALCPGAEYGPAKRWPPAHFAAVASAHIRRGGGVWLFGADNDAPSCAAIRAALPAHERERVIDLAGRTRLLDALDLLSLAEQVVTNDSGLMHVASALGLPVIAVFGSSSAAFTPPLSVKARVVRDELPCSPCFERSCPLGHTNCLNGLLPDRVLAELGR